MIYNCYFVFSHWLQQTAFSRIHHFHWWNLGSANTNRSSYAPLCNSLHRCELLFVLSPFNFAVLLIRGFSFTAGVMNSLFSVYGMKYPFYLWNKNPPSKMWLGLTNMTMQISMMTWYLEEWTQVMLRNLLNFVRAVVLVLFGESSG